jgi:hypothetical protein
MNKITKTLLLIFIIGGVISGLVYKAMNPNDYQDPRYRTSQ